MQDKQGPFLAVPDGKGNVVVKPLPRRPPPAEKPTMISDRPEAGTLVEKGGNPDQQPAAESAEQTLVVEPIPVEPVVSLESQGINWPRVGLAIFLVLGAAGIIVALEVGVRAFLDVVAERDGYERMVSKNLEWNLRVQGKANKRLMTILELRAQIAAREADDQRIAREVAQLGHDDEPPVAPHPAAMKLGSGIVPAPVTQLRDGLRDPFATTIPAQPKPHRPSRHHRRSHR